MEDFHPTKTKVEKGDIESVVSEFRPFVETALDGEGRHRVRLWRFAERMGANVTTLDFEPLTVAVPLWEDPPGVFRVGNSRVLLELVLAAFKRGESPETIVRSYRTLRLADVYAVISRYLANPDPFDQYLRQCAEEAEAVRRTLDAAGMTSRVSKEEFLARARAKGLLP